MHIGVLVEGWWESTSIFNFSVLKKNQWVVLSFRANKQTNIMSLYYKDYLFSRNEEMSQYAITSSSVPESSYRLFSSGEIFNQHF